MPVKAENSSTLPDVQNAFAPCTGPDFKVGLGPVVLARVLPRLNRGGADCLSLASGWRNMLRSVKWIEWG